MSIRRIALAALESPDLDQKVHLAVALSAQSATEFIANLGEHEILECTSVLPGQPEKPTLMRHLDVPQLSIFTPRGLAGLVHSVCHIEFNAINTSYNECLNSSNNY